MIRQITPGSPKIPAIPAVIKFKGTIIPMPDPATFIINNASPPSKLPTSSFSNILRGKRNTLPKKYTAKIHKAYARNMLASVPNSITTS